MTMANIHSVFWCLLLVISVFWCVQVFLRTKSYIVLKHPYWAVRLTKICDNSPSDYLPSISRLVTHATRLTLNSIIPNILEIILVH